jgi:hypothetical protein
MSHSAAEWAVKQLATTDFYSILPSSSSRTSRTLVNPVISGPAHSSPARHKRLQPGAALHLYPFGVQKRPSVESPPECEEIMAFAQPSSPQVPLQQMNKKSNLEET